MNEQQQVISTLDDAVQAARKTLADTPAGCSVVLGQHTVQLMLDGYLHTTPARERLSIPIRIGFDGAEVGRVDMDAASLPPTPQWCLALGFKATTAPPESSPGYELVEFSIASDSDYAAYLQHQGEGVARG